MSSWISHVKAYQREHPGLTYGEAMKAARSSWAGKKTTKKTTKGKGVIKDVARAIKNTFFFPATRLPGNSQAVYNKHKDAVILGITIFRRPVMNVLERALNFMSMGIWEKKKKELGYDKLFHLGMVLNTDEGKITVEKIERVRIAEGGVSGGEMVTVPYDKAATLAEFLKKGLDRMGEHRFYQYNGFENNCQDFILNLLAANGVLSTSAREFIKQDVESIARAMPGFIRKVSQAVTDANGKFLQLRTGQGRKRRKLTKKKV